MKKHTFIFTITIYLLGLLYGVINSNIDLSLLFKDINIEKVLFITYNAYIILSSILIGFNLIKDNKILYRFCICSFIGYIIFHSIYFIWQVYKILIMYDIKSDAQSLISNAFINPTGALPSILILFILLQMVIKLNKKKD